MTKKLELWFMPLKILIVVDILSNLRIVSEWKRRSENVNFYYFAEQKFRLNHYQNELKIIKNILSEKKLTFEDLQIKYDLIDFPIIRINSTGKLFNVTLQEGVEWNDFYETAIKIADTLNSEFTKKIEDIDSKYWDIEFEGKTFTLHYNSMIGDVELLTEYENGVDSFENLLLKLKNGV